MVMEQQRRAASGDGSGVQPRSSEGMLQRPATANAYRPDTTLTSPTPLKPAAGPSMLQPKLGWAAAGQEQTHYVVTAPRTPTLPRPASSATSTTGRLSSNGKEVSAAPLALPPAWTLDNIKEHIAQIQGVVDAAHTMVTAAPTPKATTRPHPSGPLPYARPSSAMPTTAASPVPLDSQTVSTQINAALAAWAKASSNSGNGAAAPPDMNSARAALLQLLSVRAGQVLSTIINGNSATLASADNEVAGNGWGLGAAVAQLQLLVAKSGVNSVEQLVSVAAASQQEVMDLKSQASYAQEDNTLLRNTLAQLRAGATANGAQATGPAEGFEQLATQLRGTITELRQQLNDTRKQAQDAQVKVSSLQSQLSDAKHAASSSTARVASADQECVVLRMRANEAETARAQAEAARAQAEHDCARVCEEVKTWQGKCERLEAQMAQTKKHSEDILSALTHNSDASLQELQQTQEQNQALQAQAVRLKEELSQHVSVESQLQQQLDEQRLVVQQMEVALADARSQAAAARGQVQSSRASADRQQEVLSRLETQMKHLQEEADRAQASRDECAAQLSVCHTDMTRMAGDLHTAKSQATERDERVKALQVELNEGRSSIARMTTEVETLSRSARDARAEADRCRSSQHQAEARLHQVQEQLETCQEWALQLQARVSELEREGEEVKARFVDASKAAVSAQEQLLQANKRADHATSEAASSRAALDAERAEIAAMKAALQQDSQTVKAMGALVQARTLRFDINSLALPDLSLHGLSDGSQGANRPVSAAHGDAGQARLANMVRELTTQLQACQARLSQQGLVTTTAQATAQTAEAKLKEVERKLQETEQRLTANEQARLATERALRESESQLSEALHQLEAGQSEMRDVRRLLESAGRAGLTTEARVVLESQLVDAKRAADDKARLAAALGDQVVSLRQDLEAMRNNMTHAPITIPTPTTSIPTPSSLPSHSETRMAPNPFSHRADSSGSGLGGGVDVASENGWQLDHDDDPDQDGEYQILLSQLRKAHADLALLTDKLQDAEATIRRQDALVTEMQARSHNSETQLALLTATTATAATQNSTTPPPRPDHTSTSTTRPGSAIGPPPSTSLSTRPTSALGPSPSTTTHTLPSRYSSTTSLSHEGILGADVAAAIVASGAGVLTANGTFRPLSALHPPGAAGALRHRPWSAMPQSEHLQPPLLQQPHMQTTQAGATTAAPVPIDVSSSTASYSSNGQSPASSQSGATGAVPTSNGVALVPTGPHTTANRLTSGFSSGFSSADGDVVPDLPYPQGYQQLTTYSNGNNGVGSGSIGITGGNTAAGRSPRAALPPPSPTSINTVNTTLTISTSTTTRGLRPGRTDNISNPTANKPPSPRTTSRPQSGVPTATNAFATSPHTALSTGLLTADRASASAAPSTPVARNPHAYHQSQGMRPMSAISSVADTSRTSFVSTPVAGGAGGARALPGSHNGGTVTGGPGHLSASGHVRPASALPAQRKTVLLLSASEPSAQAGLPSLAQATADAQRFLVNWNNKR